MRSFTEVFGVKRIPDSQRATDGDGHRMEGSEGCPAIPTTSKATKRRDRRYYAGVPETGPRRQSAPVLSDRNLPQYS